MRNKTHAFRGLITEIERLPNLAHNEDQSNHALCRLLVRILGAQLGLTRSGQNGYLKCVPQGRGVIDDSYTKT